MKTPLILLLALSITVLTGCGNDETDPTENASPVSPPTGSTDHSDPGEEWVLSWSDEFEGDSLDENIWTRQRLMSPYNQEWQQYTGDPQTAYVEDGNLVIKAEMKGDTYEMGGFTSARVISNPGGQDGNAPVEGKTFLYGKIAARIKLPYGKGIWPAFWMLGDNHEPTGGDTPWPACGEIDILESGYRMAPNYGQGTISGTLHHDPSPNNTVGRNEFLSAGEVTLDNDELLAEKFRVYEIEWNEQEIIWRLDGVEYGRVYIAVETRDEFHKPMYAIFNIAVGGIYTADPDASTPFPQYMYVDWIRHYTK